MRTLALVLPALVWACVPFAAAAAPRAVNENAASPADDLRLGEWQSKLAPGLLQDARRGEVESLILLAEQADLGPAATLHSKQDKGRWVFQTLQEVAQRSQAGIRRQLQEQGVEHQPFWIANMILARCNATTLHQLAQRTEVARVIPNLPLQRLEPHIEPDHDVPPDPAHPTAGVEWNITRIQAPAVWAAGVTGAGAVVGGMDTGYDWRHPALVRQYRGTRGSSVEHDYNWHDAVHRTLISHCPGDSPEPCDGDLSGHGTHTMGTILGDDGVANQIGVAPGARWIGCRCWEEERRTALSYVTECFQWFVAPTNLDGANADPDLAPHAISNSWVCDPGEGCADPDILRAIVENVRAAGIVVVGGAGNDGPDCSTVVYPPAIYGATLSVGATTSTDAIARFSSRGPVVIDGSNRVKPDLCAPGANIRSSVPGGTYQGGWNGTSMATPHVTGVVALLISAVPELAGQVDLIEDILRDTVVPLTSTQSCGGVPGTQIPNHTFGHGRLDAYAAYRKALSLQTDIADPLQPGGSALQSPATTRLLANRPNPFNPGTRVHFDLREDSVVSLQIYDIAGRVVRRLLAPRFEQAGTHAASWDGRDDAGRPLPSGVYVVRLTAGRLVVSRQLTLLR